MEASLSSDLHAPPTGGLSSLSLIHSLISSTTVNAPLTCFPPDKLMDFEQLLQLLQIWARQTSMDAFIDSSLCTMPHEFVEHLIRPR